MNLHDIQMVLFIAAGIALLIVAGIVVVTVIAGIFRGQTTSELADRPRQGREERPK